jgi:hypothetical protein
MQHAHEINDGAASEMAIVDTFTKLIFGEVDTYSNLELGIIQALRTVDVNVALDSRQDIGEYLRALGVQEMIHLVSRVRQQLITGPVDAPGVGRSVVDSDGQPALNRR